MMPESHTADTKRFTSIARGSISAIMASIRSNLNSVSSVSGGLTKIKNQLTTCFQDWYRKSANYSTSHTHHSFHPKTPKNLKLFNTRLKKLFSPKKNKDLERAAIKRTSQNCKNPKVEIVAKLLSSTLLATTTTITTTEFEKFTKEEELNMTITNDTFMQIRDEYPDLEAEVRSILVAHAQEGATISEIKDDYKNMTGLFFPIYNNITDFLLSIPSVSALCNERGTRIFNIVPTEKTKHLYDMVLSQKPLATKPSYTPYGRNTYCGNRFRLNDRHNNNNYNYNKNNRYNYRNNYKNNNNYNNIPSISTMAKYQQCLEKNSVRSDSAESVVENNCFYEDNCYYISSRFCGTRNLPPPVVGRKNDLNNNHKVDFTTPNNKTGLNTNDLEPFANQMCKRKQPPMELALTTDVTNNPSKRAAHINSFEPPRILRPAPLSSPTATRSSDQNESIFTIDSDYEAHLLDFPLLGDDFFLYLARMELKCKFKKYEKVLQAGLCVSGQTIGAAIKRIRHLVQGVSLDRSVIVNIGSVDLMQGRPLVQIQHDFRELVNIMHKNGLTPILTTLAPLANYSHIPQVKERLERFNEFIKREGRFLCVIDIWSCLVNEKCQTLFDCFQNEPRNVTGTPEPYVFWNKIGRQRVLQLIESKIEY